MTGHWWAGRQSDRQMQPENMGKEDLLTVFVPCGRVQPDTDLFELGRLEGSRVTLRGKRKKEGSEVKMGGMEKEKFRVQKDIR